MRSTKFLKILCPRCKTVQIVCGKSSTLVKCLSCNYLLLRTSGGKAQIRAQVKEIL